VEAGQAAVPRPPRPYYTEVIEQVPPRGSRDQMEIRCLSPPTVPLMNYSPTNWETTWEGKGRGKGGEGDSSHTQRQNGSASAMLAFTYTLNGTPLLACLNRAVCSEHTHTIIISLSSDMLDTYTAHAGIYSIYVHMFTRSGGYLVYIL